MPLARDTGVPVNVLQSLSITYLTATAAVPGQMVDWVGNLVTAAATPIMGVLRTDGIQGQKCSVAVAGMVEVLSGAAVAIGNAIGADATGRGIPVAAGTRSIGRAMSAATAAGQKIQVYITHEGTN